MNLCKRRNAKTKIASLRNPHYEFILSAEANRISIHQIITEEKMAKLIVLRGNSGSGKTTTAKNLQKKFGRNTMVISQDAIRREMLMATDGPDSKAIPLMENLLDYGYKHCEIVILEGIMYADWYKPLFELAKKLYQNQIYAYYFDIPFEETMKRHQTRQKSAEFGEAEMREWWREKDYSDILMEAKIGQELSMEQITDLIYSRLA